MQKWYDDDEIPKSNVQYYEILWEIVTKRKNAKEKII